jgi:LysM repeat protein
LISTSLFATPLSDALSIETVLAFGQETAQAQTAIALGITPGTPIPVSITPATATATLLGGTAITPQTGITFAPTTSFQITTVATTPAIVTPIPGGPTPTLGPRPSTYTLQSGEWPFCIARRYNLDPDELLALNGLVDNETVFPGLTLKIPQTGNPFPGPRAWHTHPATYTVNSSDQTIFGIACYYGDIDPARIAQANGLSVSATLSAGQNLTIP